jgi:hypothetical protein
MKIEEGYLEGNLTKSVRQLADAAKILKLQQNMDFFNTL